MIIDNDNTLWSYDKTVTDGRYPHACLLRITHFLFKDLGPFKQFPSLLNAIFGARFIGFQENTHVDLWITIFMGKTEQYKTK